MSSAKATFEVPSNTAERAPIRKGKSPAQRLSRARWTLRLLEGKVVELAVVARASEVDNRASARKLGLGPHLLGPHPKSQWVIGDRIERLESLVHLMPLYSMDFRKGDRAGAIIERRPYESDQSNRHHHFLWYYPGHA